MVIIDASVVYKWFAENEPHHQLAIELLQKYLLGNEQISVPDLLLYEITNAWSTKTRLGIKQVEQNLHKLETFGLSLITVSFPLLHQASHIAMAYQVSVYDAVYVAIAQDNDCGLITADAKLQQRVNLPFIKLLGNG